MANRILVPILLAMLLSACATSRDVTRADGWKTHVVSCGGPLLNMGHCLEKAGAICRGYGYTILNKEGGELPASPDAIPTGGLPDMPKSASDLTNFQGRTLYIRCNG
ncbi:MAG: hypothetical protein HGA75_07500 [Thiobacillus sp.]|nr:hypothetical protein [Thiobacillus sp.]